MGTLLVLQAEFLAARALRSQRRIAEAGREQVAQRRRVEGGRNAANQLEMLGYRITITQVAGTFLQFAYLVVAYVELQPAITHLALHTSKYGAGLARSVVRRAEWGTGGCAYTLVLRLQPGGREPVLSEGHRVCPVQDRRSGGK